MQAGGGAGVTPGIVNRLFRPNNRLQSPRSGAREPSVSDLPVQGRWQNAEVEKRWRCVWGERSWRRARSRGMTRRRTSRWGSSNGRGFGAARRCSGLREEGMAVGRGKFQSFECVSKDSEL
jgi:hypothetical protein